MKRFKYSLNKLLNMRLGLEKEASQKFTDISTRIKVINNNIETLNKLYKKNSFSTCTTRVDEIIKNNYAYFLENSILYNKKQKEKMSKEYDYRFEDYKKKKQDRNVLDKLKDKEYKEFLHEQDKEEQDFLDELSLNMYYKDLHKLEDSDEKNEKERGEYEFEDR